MVFLRVLGGLLVATIVGLILGAIKDYLGLWPDAAFKFVWPLGMGAAAFAGAVVMALMKPSRYSPVANLPAKPTTTAAHAMMKTPAGTSADVPGMPTFDFDKARSAGTDGPTGATAAKPKEQA
jgi:hypothetical protein